MSQIHFLHRNRRYLNGDFAELPLLAYEDFESSTLGQVALLSGWAAAGKVITYAGGIGYEDFETSTLSGNTPPGPDYGWTASGTIYFTLTVPTKIVASIGETVTATVSTSGVGSFTYQWFQNGSLLSNGGEYSGVTTATLTITGLTSPDYTTYFCAVTSIGVTINSPTFSILSVGTDWSNRVVTNGGATPSGGSVTAIDTFFNGLVTDGLKSKMYAVNCFAPDSLIAAITPQYVGMGLDPWTNTNFVSGDLTVNGLTGNASNKRLDSGFNPNTASGFLGLGGQSFYVYNAPGSVNGFEGGCQDSTNILGVQAKNGTTTVTINGNGAQGIVTTSPGNGFYSDDRTSSTVRKAYFASSGTSWAQIGATDSNTFSSYPNLHCWIFCLNQNGSVNVISNDTLSFGAYHLGLSSSDGQKLFNRVQTLRTSFGGGFR